MNSRDRILAAIGHVEPDRVPIIIGASNATGIQMQAYQKLKRLIKIDAPDRYLYDWPELGTASLDEEAFFRLHSDVRPVLDKFPQNNYQRNAAREPGTPFIDSWGIGQEELAPGKWFPNIHPLAGAETIADIENYSWPDMDDPTRILGVREAAAQLIADNKYAVMATPWLLFPFERAALLQGMEAFLLNLAMRPDFSCALLEKITELCKQLMGHFLDALGDNVDIIKIGDDLGTQHGLLISPQMYRQCLKPFHADYISFIKKHTKAKVFFHSDGDVFPIIEDLIEIGVDVLNPIQTSAGNMSNLVELKKRYGRQLTFCGAIDTHYSLPKGSTEEVTDEVRRVIDILAPGGGYILASVHTIMDEVPPENILAMVDAAEKYGNY